ncbi:MAG TPA: hypothetical protein VHU84_14350 [Lacipirellulaceae bacterium]|jgi:hypothetical protein|nr:hypothetical protein [Lacipirellulaceae bacterium]
MHAIPTNLWQWLSSLNSDEYAGLVIGCVVTLVSVCLIVAITIHSVHKNRLSYQMKRELLDRGLSADEIATIIGADRRRLPSVEDQVSMMRAMRGKND